jgi:multimeric flavodoxin WrbA
MKKVTTFVGSVRKKNTYRAVGQFMNNLQALGDIQYEIVVLNNYKLSFCRGCMLCFNQGEEYCPLKDDRDILKEKIMASDGVVFATPNYSFGMSGLMKAFLDRFGFAFHRPGYFGKTFTSIVTQAYHRGNDIVKYFDFVGTVLGFNMVKGVCLTSLETRTEKDQQKIDRALAELSKRFYATLDKTAYPVPSLPMLMSFRMVRSNMKERIDNRSRDYQYFAEKGWLESDYYYPTHLSMLKKIAGNIFDRMAPVIQKMIA